MKLTRKSFLKLLPSLPFIPTFLKDKDIPKSISGEQNNNQQLIPDVTYLFTPEEIIKSGFIYVNTPIFNYNNQNYCTRLFKTKIRILYNTQFFWNWKSHYQEIITNYIKYLNNNTLPITHIHSIFTYPNLPIINPDSSKFYPVFFKGCSIYSTTCSTTSINSNDFKLIEFNYVNNPLPQYKIV